jgi:hypothetical protein
VAVASACRRLGLPEPVIGTAALFSGEATGLLVKLSGWLYPVVFDTATGQARYDNYEGAWGDPKHLDSFMQMYAVEKAHRSPQAWAQRCRTGPPRRLGETHDSGGRCLVKTIEITVNPKGATKVETKGFTGAECREASRFIEQALGTRTAETLTAEYHQGQQTAQELKQSQ